MSYDEDLMRQVERALDAGHAAILSDEVNETHNLARGLLAGFPPELKGFLDGPEVPADHPLANFKSPFEVLADLGQGLSDLGDRLRQNP